MTKRTIKETTREYDESGKLIREIITETTEDDDTQYRWHYEPMPQYTPCEITCGQFSATSSANS